MPEAIEIVSIASGGCSKIASSGFVGSEIVRAIVGITGACVKIEIGTGANKVLDDVGSGVGGLCVVRAVVDGMFVLS